MRQTALWPRPGEGVNMTKIKRRFTFSLTSCVICTVLNNLQMISQWTVRHNVNVILFRITMKWSRKRLIYLPRWLITIRDGKVSLHSWEFTLSMACQCDLHNWILTSVLLIVCSFTRWTLQSFWIVMKSEFHSWNACLYIPLKIIVSMYNHSSTRFPYLSVNHHCGIYSTSLGTDSQFQTMWMIIPRSTCRCSPEHLLANSSRIKIIYGHLDDSSGLFQNRESGFYFTKVLAAYTTKM